MSMFEWGGKGKFSKIYLQGAVLASRLEAEDTKSRRDNHLLLAVVRRGDTLEDLEAFESGSSTGGLFGNRKQDHQFLLLLSSRRLVFVVDPLYENCKRTLWGTIPRIAL